MLGRYLYNRRLARLAEPARAELSLNAFLDRVRTVLDDPKASTTTKSVWLFYLRATRDQDVARLASSLALDESSPRRLRLFAVLALLGDLPFDESRDALRELANHPDHKLREAATMSLDDLRS